jgi:DNA polymerase III delta prime subunit
VNKSEKENVYKYAVRKSLEETSLQRQMRRWWEEKIKMKIRELGSENRRWMELAQDRVQWQALVLAVLNLRVLLPVLVN